MDPQSYIVLDNMFFYAKKVKICFGTCYAVLKDVNLLKEVTAFPHELRSEGGEVAGVSDGLGGSGTESGPTNSFKVQTVVS